MTTFTLTEAAREVGRSKSTLLRAIDAGRLSASKNEHGDYRVDAAELFRVYSPQEQQQGTVPTAQPDTATAEVVSKLVSQLAAKDEKIERMEADLDDTEKRLAEHREASRALMSPEDFQARLKAEVERLEQAQMEKLNAQKEHHKAALNAQQTEQVRLAAKERQQYEKKSEEWELALAERKREIAAARNEATELEQRTEQERKARESLSQQLAEIESRGFIARLLNRKPKFETAG